MQSIPQISCIITTYNRAPFLADVIGSVLKQNYDNYELIVIDDGSTDATHSIIKQYSDKLLYVIQSHKGVSAARNCGLRESRGAYIAYLDSDDLWMPNKLALQSRFLDQNSDFPLCYTDEIWYRNGVRVNQRDRHQKYSGNIFSRCLPLCIISPSSAMIRKEVLMDLGGFDEELPAGEDYDLWLRIAARYPVYLLPLPLIIKRGGHAGQLSKGVEHLDKWRIRAIVKCLTSDILSQHQREAALTELSTKCSIYATGCEKHGKLREAAYYREIPSMIRNRGRVDWIV